MSNQMSIFDFMFDRPKPKKKIRLIELFAGIGSQYKALKEITKGTDYEVEPYKICEWAVPSIRAYNSIHIKDTKDYSADKTFQEMLEKVKMVSLNYNSPIGEKSNRLKDEKWVRDVYNNIIATHNLVNIMEAKGSDFEIVDTDKYEYIMSYSFPCQDLSKAGKQAGLEVSQKDGGTRSGLLWEVERILTELDYEHRPDCLLLENVPDLIEKNFIKSWHKWLEKLEELGYTNYVDVLNSKDYGIAQNRRRFFCVSIKKQCSYSFPKKIPLLHRLKDFEDEVVDEKYFLTKEHIKRIEKWKAYEKPLENLMGGNDVAGTLTTHVGKDSGGMKLLAIPENEQSFVSKKYSDYAKEHDGKIPKMFNPYNEKEIVDIAPAQTAQCGSITSSSAVLIKEEKPSLKKELCESLIEQGKVQEGDIVKHSFTKQIMSGKKKAVEKQDEMITLTTRGDTFGVVVEDKSVFTGIEKELFTEDGNIRRYIGSDVIDKFEEGQMATTTFPNGYGHGPRTHDESIALNTIDRPCIKTNLRIRKLTPCECIKLMGFEKKDWQAMKDIGMSDMQIYHCAGDSIVVPVLMGIFAEYLGVDDYEKRIITYTNGLCAYPNR